MTTENTEQKQSLRLKLFTKDPTTGNNVFKGYVYPYTKGLGFTAYVDGIRCYTVADNTQSGETTEGEGA